MADIRLQSQPKAPPYSVEAEQSVLGGIMLENRWFEELADKLRPEYFYRDDHQLIYRAIAELAAARKPCDFVTVADFLKQRGQYDEAGGHHYLGSLANDTPSAANVAAYAEIVRDHAVLRMLAQAGGEIADLGYRPDGRSFDELLDIAERKVMTIRARRQDSKGEAADMADLVPQIEAAIEKRRGGDGVPGLSSGILQLDQRTTGFHPGDLIVVAGRPSMGKTTFALNVAEHCAFVLQQTALVFSMEMPAEQLAQRTVASRARVPLTAIRTGQMTMIDMDNLVGAGVELRTRLLKIDDSSALSPNQLRAKARRVKARFGLSLIVVDYIQLMQVPGNKENRTNEIAEISRNLKALAKELEVPVIVLSQLNRGVEQRDNKRPRMADLRESGGIEQDADVCLFIYRDEVYNPESPEAGTAEIIIGKQRQGPLGTVRTAFQGDFCTFANLAHDWAPIERPPDSSTEPAKPRSSWGKRRPPLGMSHAAHTSLDD